MSENNTHTDHRARMRERVVNYGLESLSEHEILEYLLFYVIPRKDTNAIAHSLMDCFGSLSGVLEASPQDLERISGIGPAAARFLCDLHQLEACSLKSRQKEKRSLSDAAALAEFLLPYFLGTAQEKLYLIALDDRCRLLRLVPLSSGGAGEVAFSIRGITREAVSAGARYVVLAHNHPNGVALPSKKDVEATIAIAKALALLDIELYDHLIFAGSEWLSLRDSGRIAK